MITNLILNTLILILSAIFYLLPIVSIADIPYIGEGVYNALVSFIGIWNAFMVTFPYAETAWNIFLLVILPFELLLLLGKFLLGHRLPANTTH